MIIRWEKTPYGQKAWYTDVPGLGRYLVRKVHRKREWIAMRNGESTCLRENSLDDIKRSVEHVIKGVM